ncbi:carbohydrate ABC transporter permease [Cohnella sp. GCM10027633]|uniref:carbohydrate ABC transporter permease n=1 Tax=unclassified Cohnella TaxID=2636738 RepID=UPI0036287DAC
MHKLMSDRRTVFTLMAPGMLLFILIVLVPIGYSFYYSLTDWNGVGDYGFVGLRNYGDILGSDNVFGQALLNSIYMGLALCIVQHPIAILIAMLVTYSGRYEKFLRIVIFIPSIISTFVTSKLWVSIFDTQFGLLNRLLGNIGLASWQQDWLGSSNWAIACIIVVCMWQGLGYAFLLYYAGIKGISQELYEAAMLDGASKAQVNLKVVLPLLAPVLRINMVLAVVSAFKQIETVYLMTGGGPFNSTQFMSTYLYTKAFRENMYGYGNAVSILLIVICLLVTVAMNRAMRRETEER